MKILSENATVEEVENFLLFHIDNADSRKSKINPSLTKADVWNINMGAIMSANITRVSNIVIKNITREFGKFYED